MRTDSSQIQRAAQYVQSVHEQHEVNELRERIVQIATAVLLVGGTCGLTAMMNSYPQYFTAFSRVVMPSAICIIVAATYFQRRENIRLAELERSGELM